MMQFCLNLIVFSVTVQTAYSVIGESIPGSHFRSLGAATSGTRLCSSGVACRLQRRDDLENAFRGSGHRLILAKPRRFRSPVRPSARFAYGDNGALNPVDLKDYFTTGIGSTGEVKLGTNWPEFPGGIGYDSTRNGGEQTGGKNDDGGFTNNWKMSERIREPRRYLPHTSSVQARDPGYNMPQDSGRVPNDGNRPFIYINNVRRSRRPSSRLKRSVDIRRKRNRVTLAQAIIYYEKLKEVIDHKKQLGQTAYYNRRYGR